jgi:transcription elongation factor SPT5
MHLYRTWAFVGDKNLIETGGVYVARTRMIVLAAAIGKKTGSTPRPASAQSAYVNPAQRIGATGPRRDNLIHKTVLIAGGPFKGYQGIVKDITEKGARIELNTNAKIVTVDRSKLLVPGCALFHSINQSYTAAKRLHRLHQEGIVIRAVP